MGQEARTAIRYSTMGERMANPVIAELMAKALENRELLSIAAGFTDNEVLPQDLVCRAVDLLGDRDKEYLQYGMNQGRPGLRRAASAYLSSYPREQAGVWNDEAMLITNGSQQCLYLAMQVLCNPGDIVLVERPSYFVFLEMLKGLGIEALALPESPGGGFAVDGIRALIASLRKEGRIGQVKAVYLVSYFSNPSSRCLPEAEKVKLATVLREEGLVVPVLEDGAYRDLYYERPYPARTVLSLPEMADFPRLFLGTFTKPLATGLKIGYGVCSDGEWRAKMQAAKGHQDFGSSHFGQAVIEVILEQGWYEPYLVSLRRHYAAKTKRMQRQLECGGLQELGWHWDQPEGGLLFWLEGPRGLDTGIRSAFCEACIGAGVLYVPGDLSLPEGGPSPFVRLSFGALPENQLEEATRRFVAVAREFS